jgi:mevalonate kinase
MVVGRGYGKLLLFGEHAAVYGYPALGLHIPQYLEVQIEPRDGAEWKLPELDSRSSELITRAVGALPQILGRDVPPHSLTIAGNLPMSVGLGSSAAFCTALLRAADPAHLATGPVTELWKAAHELERVFHGTPSGIDTGLSLLEGCSLIYPDPPGIPSAESVMLPAGWLVIGAVPRTGSTAELVAGIRDRRERNPAGTDDLLKDLGSISERAGHVAGESAIEQLGELADQAQALLSGLSLCTPEVEEALLLLGDSGARGGKMSGAGGGGAFFGIFRHEPTAREAARMLTDWLETRHPLPTGPFAVAVGLR